MLVTPQGQPLFPLAATSLAAQTLFFPPHALTPRTAVQKVGVRQERECNADAIRAGASKLADPAPSAKSRLT